VGLFEKSIENGLDQPHNCEKHHWNRLKEVLAQEDNIERAIRMKGIQTTQNNVSRIGRTSDIGLEEPMVIFLPFVHDLKRVLLNSLFKGIYIYYKLCG
jgi:hypothetical protein